MPLIEELPVTTTIKASHGWAYVPDTGPIAAQQPGTRDRKRTTTVASRNRNIVVTTAKREKAIQQRLDALNKENYKDVNVPVPPRKSNGKKVTSNVRRILAYQRNFAHYLAEEEAAHPNATHYALPTLPTGMLPPQTPASATVAPTVKHQATKDTGKRKSRNQNAIESPVESPMPSTPTTQPRGTTRKERAASRSMSKTVELTPAPAVIASSPQEDINIKSEDTTILASSSQAKISNDVDTVMSDTLPVTTSDSASLTLQPNIKPYPSHWDTDPLLVSTPDSVPRMPSDRVMQLLISEPPLTFTAARATPLDEDQRAPARKFCGVCGYWGKVKCRKCDEYTCGLMACWTDHKRICVNAGML